MKYDRCQKANGDMVFLLDSSSNQNEDPVLNFLCACYLKAEYKGKFQFCLFLFIYIPDQRSSLEPLEWEHWLQDPRLSEN